MLPYLLILGAAGAIAAPILDSDKTAQIMSTTRDLKENTTVTWMGEMGCKGQSQHLPPFLHIYSEACSSAGAEPNEDLFLPVYGNASTTIRSFSAGVGGFSSVDGVGSHGCRERRYTYPSQSLRVEVCHDTAGFFENIPARGFADAFFGFLPRSPVDLIQEGNGSRDLAKRQDYLDWETGHGVKDGKPIFVPAVLDKFENHFEGGVDEMINALLGKKYWYDVKTGETKLITGPL